MSDKSKNIKKAKKPTRIMVIDIDKEVGEWEGEVKYFNGFSCGVGIGDITIILKQNNKNVAVMNTSYRGTGDISAKNRIGL